VVQEHVAGGSFWIRKLLVAVTAWSFHTVCLIYAVRSEGAFHQWRERCINHGEFRPVAIGKIGRLANPRDIRQRHKAGV
jgi:hypothetical protein